MEVYPEKWTVYRITHYMYCPFFGGIPPSTAKLLSYYLSFNLKRIMSKIQFDINFANSNTIEVATDVLPVWCMEIYYPFRFNQSKSLLHAEIK